MTANDATLHLSPVRRALLFALHWLHWGALAYGCLGWLIPNQTALWVHIGFIAFTLLQWLVNRDTCVLDSLRSWLMTGAWRARETNPEEGRWIATQLERITGLNVPTSAANVVIYAMIVILGLLSWLHLERLGA